MLDEHTVLKNGNLRPVAALPDSHDPIHRLAAGEELRLGQDGGSAPAGLPPLTAALTSRLQARRSLDGPNPVGLLSDGLTDVDHGVRWVAGLRAEVLGTLGDAPATAAAPASR
jgi:hypothetical protein